MHIHDAETEPVELGASIFVAVNRILVETASELGLRIKSDDDSGPSIPSSAVGAELGVWDGEAFRFLLPRNEPAWRLAGRMLWRYGTAPLRVQALNRNIVDRFLKLYEPPPFPSLTDAAAAADLLNITDTTGAAYLEANGVGTAYATDIVQASTRVNYAQNLTHIHALEALVCMSTDGGTMAIRGGNWRIFAGMLAASDAHLQLETAATKVERRADGRFVLSTNTTGDAVYDAVVVAAPWHQADLAFAPAPERVPAKVAYVHLHVTLFTSPYRLRPGFFRRPAHEAAPGTILTTLRPEGTTASLAFFSISLLRAVTHPTTGRLEYAYKIFSPAPLSARFLHSLLDVPAGIDPPTSRHPDVGDDQPITWFHHKRWLSYPYLPPRREFDGPVLPYEDDPFRPPDEPEEDDGLYYTGGIESFISTMETSALMGRNVAKLVVEKFAKAGARNEGPGLRVQGQAAREGMEKTEL